MTFQCVCKNQVSLKSIILLTFIIRAIKTTYKNISVALAYLVAPKLATVQLQFPQSVNAAHTPVRSDRFPPGGSGGSSAAGPWLT